MLKKGQVYKLTYKFNKDDLGYWRRDNWRRDNMIISPAYDINVMNISNKKISVIKCLFHINLGNYVCRNIEIGILDVIKIEKPTTKEDFDDIGKAMEISGLTYNRKWNRIEGYETGEVGIFTTIK